MKPRRILFTPVNGSQDEIELTSTGRPKRRLRKGEMAVHPTPDPDPQPTGELPERPPLPERPDL